MNIRLKIQTFDTDFTITLVVVIHSYQYDYC